jgi:D-ribose pyranose/furanose isomerase RbsD
MKPMTDDARKVELDRLELQAKQNIQRTHSVKFLGENHNLPAFKVDISFPLFRMENGRTKRKQLEFVYNHPERAHELDDPSSASAQAIQLAILQDMAEESDLLELLKQGQHEPLLLRHDGYVVNGNRRLAAMRLIHSDANKNKVGPDFSYVEVVRLPELDEKEIRRIEQRLQMSQDGKADYNWVDELLTIHANIEEYGMTTLELAKDMNKKKPTVEKQLKMLTLIDMFLERTNKRGKYFEVESDEQAFKTLADGYSKYQGDSGKQTMLLDLAFPIILKNEPGESKHKRIAKITEYLSQIVAKIEADEAYVAEEVKEGNSASKDILDTVPSSNTFKPLSLKLTSDSSEIVHQAIRAVDRENDFQDMANGPAEAVTAAASLLKNIQVTSSMTKKKQFRGQLKAIQTTCELLIAEVDKLEKSNSIVD